MTDPIAVSVAPSERREIVEVARDLGRRELLPHALELDERRPGVVDAAWEHVTEVGFDRALMAVEDGGAGLDADTLLLCLEELAAGDGGIAMLALLSNAALAVLPPERLAQIPPGSRWALVPAPPEQLPTAARVRMEKHGGAIALNGRLCPAVGALGADGLMIVAREPEPVALAFPAGTKGLDVAVSEPQLGLRAAAAACVSFSDAAADLTLGEAAAAVAVPQSFSLLRAGVAAIARGVARRAQEMAVSYAETRLQGGVPIVEHDAVRGMLAAMAVRLSAAPCPSAASGVVLGRPADGGGHADENGASAIKLVGIKIATTDAAVATTTDAVQVFGGAGYMHETGIEKLMRDAKSLQVWPEPNWVGSELVADALSPQPSAAVQS